MRRGEDEADRVEPATLGRSVLPEPPDYVRNLSQGAIDLLVGCKNRAHGESRIMGEVGVGIVAELAELLYETQNVLHEHGEVHLGGVRPDDGFHVVEHSFHRSIGAFHGTTFLHLVNDLDQPIIGEAFEVTIHSGAGDVRASAVKLTGFGACATENLNEQLASVRIR